MSPRAAALQIALSALFIAGCGHSVGQGSKRLGVDAPRWWFSVLPVAVEIVPSGILAERDVSVAVSVGANVAGRWELGKKPKTIWISGSHFAAGKNQVAVKTGSERAVAEVAIVSVAWLLALVGLAAATAGALVARWRGRRTA